jgi:hypothetical protein
MQAMAEREQDHPLGGDVLVDDAYLGGELPGGKPGRGSENKVPFVAWTGCPRACWLPPLRPGRDRKNGSGWLRRLAINPAAFERS